MILFKEDHEFGYKSRTKKNALAADATIAIGTDFTTPGEKLTKQAVTDSKQKYIPIKYNVLLNSVENVIKQLNIIQKQEIVLNIAGNGIYTLAKSFITQDNSDEYVYAFLKELVNSKDLKVKIKSIRTGGQTGIDESGAKASARLNIPTLILAPRGWKFRNIKDEDITDEFLFKERFTKYSNEYIQKTFYGV